MKQVLLAVLIIGIAMLSMLKLSLDREYRQFETEQRQVTNLNIYLNEPIEDLSIVTLIICDSIYTFEHHEVKDTIFDKFAIADRTFPCAIEMKYQYLDGTSTLHALDSFNCAGCSGTHHYGLSRDSVSYVYHP